VTDEDSMEGARRGRFQGVLPESMGLSSVLAQGRGNRSLGITVGAVIRG
jgi:hypothetical protein